MTTRRRPGSPDADAGMPPEAPLEMLVQDFGATVGPRRDPQPDLRLWTWRALVFAPALASTFLLVGGMQRWLAEGGMTALEWVLLILVGATFVWVTLSVSTVTAALAGLYLRRRARPGRPAEPIRTALLVPIYEEVPSDVFGNAAAMLEDLARHGGRGRFTLFILSDTRDPHVAAQERRAYEMLRDTAPHGLRVHYRRRVHNTDRKVGNIADWITRWGADHDAMLVLDADSLMSGHAICRLARELAADPEAGLIQSCPVLIGAETLFARVQQFSNAAYGGLLAEGLALWSAREGNYWGHNAIIRTRAFAASAGLPHLAGGGADGTLILSHDFVEAGLLRRAGWSVRFLPRIGGSYEETPATLVDYILRDRRWCRGNLQHLRLLATRGFHPVSRYHLAHGAISYLLAPMWFALLVIWALLGNGGDNIAVRYFDPDHPLTPVWPEISQIDSWVFLAFMYSMLVAPKVAGAAIIAATPRSRRIYGGRARFLTGFGFELAVSVAYAPILMVQQTMAVAMAIFGKGSGWTPQNRSTAGYPVGTLIKFHGFETAIGALLTLGLGLGLVSLWLLPIAASLLLSVPLSALGSLDLSRWARGGFRLETPQSLFEPPIVTRAYAARRALHEALSRPAPERQTAVAAE